MSWQLVLVLVGAALVIAGVTLLHRVAELSRRRTDLDDESRSNVRVLPARDPDDWGFGEWQ